ncbi:MULTISPECIES: hypothetical protein [Streptomyces]|uniref:hypothetical protein n=1 Tax=Streptomyces TaxID=1883 RepID=UPI001872E47D|nr:hypothetical protein [Streptomyces caniscabiei]MBE4797402.1 hypothetical protein [Streptomyces caniscabiei]
MTPDESLDVELTFTADLLAIMGKMPRDEFLAQPCKVEQMPRVEYRKTFDRSPERDKGLEEMIRKGRSQQARQDVPDAFRATPAAFEEEE